MRIGGVLFAQALSVRHAHELFLTLVQAVKPLGRKAVVRIELEEQHVFAVVSKERVAIAVTCVGAAAVPALTVKDNHRSSWSSWLYFVFDIKVLWRSY